MIALLKIVNILPVHLKMFMDLEKLFESNADDDTTSKRNDSLLEITSVGIYKYLSTFNSHVL